MENEYENVDVFDGWAVVLDDVDGWALVVVGSTIISCVAVYYDVVGEAANLIVD